MIHTDPYEAQDNVTAFSTSATDPKWKSALQKAIRAMDGEKLVDGVLQLTVAERDIMLVALESYQLDLKTISDGFTAQAIKDDLDYAEMRALIDPFDTKRQQAVDLASRVRQA